MTWSLILVNIIIDLFMVKIAKGHLKTKRATVRNAYYKLKNRDLKAIQMKKLKEVHKSNNNMTKLIVYQLVVYAVCRLPEVIFYLHFTIIDIEKQDVLYWMKYSELCYIYLCPVFINIIQFLFMLSYLSNIYFYFLFNKQFKKGFKYFFTRNEKYHKEEKKT